MNHRIRQFLSFLYCLLFGILFLGCAGPLTLQSLRELNPQAYANQICGVPEGTAKNVHFYAINIALNKIVTDRDPEALRRFMPRADSVHEVNAWAPLSSAKTVPTSMDVSCPVHETLPPDLQTEFDAIVASSCTSAGEKRPDPRYAGQTWVDGRNPLGELSDKMLVSVLKWAVREAAASEPRIPIPQTRQQVPLPPVEWEPVETVSEAEEPLTLEDSRVQFGSGAAAGAFIGAVPFGPMGADVAIELRLLPKGTYWARVGKACGEIVVGTGQMILGCAGMGAGVGMTGTGGGAPAGVLVVAGSYAIIANGCATTIHGGGDLGHLLREGDVPAESSAPAERRLVLKKAVKKPATPAPVAEAPPAAKPAQAQSTVPPETTTTTKYKDTGKTVTTRSSGTTTTTQPKPAPVNNPASSGTTTVYYAKNAAGQVQYVGLTDEFAIRAANHLRQRGFKVKELIEGLSRSDARAVEQALIEIHGLGKNGGTLLNKINSIAKTNPAFAQQLQLGYKLLNKIGYN